MSDKKYREFWIYRDLRSGSCHFSTTPIKDSNEYEYMNHLVEHSAYNQAIYELDKSRADHVSKLQALEAENEYLKRQLADERSGDCDKDKTIRRLESNFKALEEQNKVLVEALEFYSKHGHWGNGPLSESVSIDPCDWEEVTLHPFRAQSIRGGKRARQALASIKGDG